MHSISIKKFVLLLCVSFTVIVATGQKKRDYAREWKKIDSLIEKAGLLKTALKEVNAIYTTAKNEKNEVQVLKALTYRMSLNDQVSEQGKYENISLLEKEILSANEPAKSILHSITGGSYWHYLQLNRWQFYNRTPTSAYQKSDLATWDLTDLYERITYHYQSSLNEEKLLKRTSLSSLDPIITKGNVRYLRPTLYDLLAHRALDYYRNDERYITRPAYAFVMDDTMAFAEAPLFTRHRFVNRDSLSLHHKALQVYQDLIAFHLNDTMSQALIDVDLARLQFVNHFGVQQNKDELYKHAIENIIEKRENKKGVSEAMYLLAEWHLIKGRTYDPMNDTTNRYALVKAREWTEKALQIKEASDVNWKASNLLNDIMRKEIRLEGEKVNSPGLPFRALLSYRNITRSYFRLIKLDKKIKDRFGRETWSDNFWTTVIKQPALRSFNHDLPDPKDLQLHRTEIKIDALPVGEYALLSSADENFSLTRNTLALQYFHVSDIAYINNANKFHVVNRRSGSPLASATVEVWREDYNYQKQSVDLRKINSYSTDGTGYFELKENTGKNRNFSYRLNIIHENDRLFLDDNFGNIVYGEHEFVDTSPREQSFLFSDRSLYRPGQIVYFKGIVTSKKTRSENASIVTGRKSIIVLFDANEQPLDSIHVTTNEFGSYSGKFTLAPNLLNGEFSIRDRNYPGEIRIKVEEYKRPKFFVEIAKPGGSYRLLDTIGVEGKATSFAGNNVSDAAVNYRVVRKAMIPMWVRDYGMRIWPPYREDEMEIAHGVATTDATGKFHISFIAIPDKSIPKSQQPVFYYEVNADVTDINGETRSASTSLDVGYQALKLHLNIPEMLHVDSLKELKVSTTNMNDSFQKQQVKLSMYKLAAPSRMFRERYWQQPDLFVMTKEEYYKHFPYDLYADENNISKWPKAQIAFEASAVSSKDSAFKIRGIKFDPGWYVIEAAAKDKYNDTVKVKTFVLLYHDLLMTPAATAGIQADKNTAEPGDRIKYRLLTNMDSLFVIHEQVKNSGNKKDLLSDKNIRQEIEITAADKGQVNILMVFVKNNRIYSQQHIIPVPYFDKQLKIDYTSFRNKTLPGTKETWKIKISGYKGEKLASELLTSMYDASLDQFYRHNWLTPNVWWEAPAYNLWQGHTNFIAVQSFEKYHDAPVQEGFVKIYDRLKTVDEGGIGQGREIALSGVSPGKQIRRRDNAATEETFMDSGTEKVEKNSAPAVANQASDASNIVIDRTAQQVPSVQPRRNLNETAFFFPALYTDSAGNVEFSFTTPEALTTWKWMLLAHTKDLAFGAGEQTMITQKELMVQPDAPRFLREGDRINFSAKIANMTGREITGQAVLQLIDPSTGEIADAVFQNKVPAQQFTVAEGGSFPAFFSLNVPFNYNKPVSWRIIASAKSSGTTVSDGEEALLPVITNRMLVTETLNLPVKGTGTKHFRFENLINSTGRKTLKHHAVTVEFTSNPAWYAVQALPYLSEQKSENTEQVFNRYYANALASMIASTSTRFKEILEKWKNEDTSAFLSNLQKNEELKSVILQETPWVLEAKTEEQQKKNIALLFDMARMSSELNAAILKLKEMQAPTGGFVWFKGGPEDRYMTQYIISGIGHLKKLGAFSPGKDKTLDEIAQNGIRYLDTEIKKDYHKLKVINGKKQTGMAGEIPVQYLYMRSFFTDVGVPGDVFAAYNYFRNQSKAGWVKKNSMMRAMIALSLLRTGDPVNAKKIIAALKESAIVNDEMGMYWKDMTGGYYWYQAPVETQAMMIEAFTEITNDSVVVVELKTWLLKNKQTNNWKTSKATADACYALLLQGSNWLHDESRIEMTLGDKIISAEKIQAGTGYFKSVIAGDSVKPSMGNVTIKVIPADTKQSVKPAWGGVYWQYFEDIDKITTASTPLKIDKKLFIQKNTDRGPVLYPLDNNNTLHTGDKVKVRIEIRSDRALEYVHMKDMRASCMEPVNVLSSYKWKDGLGYYESTKDASTNFFINFLPKGVFVFEYELFVTHTGAFSNGITTIQCMYAPEFISHSEGIIVNVENK